VEIEFFAEFVENSLKTIILEFILTPENSKRIQNNSFCTQKEFIFNLILPQINRQNDNSGLHLIRWNFHKIQTEIHFIIGNNPYSG